MVLLIYVHQSTDIYARVCEEEDVKRRRRRESMTKLSAVIQLTPEGTPKASEALLYYKLVGKEIKATPSVGTKPAPKNITLMGFASDVDPKSPLEDADTTRSYEVFQEVSNRTLEASGLDMADTKAMLLINGKALEISEVREMILSPDTFESAKEYGDQPGLIIKHFLCALFGEKNIVGGCYLFKSMEDIDTYLSSDFWKKAQENFDFWENVTYEAYEVCSE